MARSAARASIIGYAMAALLMLAFPCAKAEAAPVWCEGEETLAAHPLNHEALGRMVEEAGARTNSRRAIALIARAFGSTQAEATDAAGHRAYLEAFRNLLNTNEGPADFHFTQQEDRDRAFLPKTGNDAVFMDCTLTPEQQNRESVTLTNIALAAYAIDRIGGEIVAPQRDIALKSIDEVTMSYRNMLIDQGLRQWPWELALNGWIHRRNPFNAEAPRWQLAFMRPDAGLEFQWASRAEASVDASIGIEPIGLVWYLGDRSDYGNWWGLSALVTLGTSDQGAGVGGLLRYRNYWLGVTDRDGESDPYFFIGFDLHKYLKSDEGLEKDLEGWLGTDEQ